MAEADKIIFPLIKTKTHSATRNSANVFTATIYPDDGYEIISILPNYCSAGKIGGGSQKVYPEISSIVPLENSAFLKTPKGYSVYLKSISSASIPNTSLPAITTYQAKI